MAEERMVLESSAKDASAIHATVNSRGWLEVIDPALKARKEAFEREILTATTLEEFFRLQQSILAIYSLIDFIENKLVEGKMALEELKRKP